MNINEPEIDEPKITQLGCLWKTLSFHIPHFHLDIPFGFPIVPCLVDNKSLFSEFGLNGHDDWAKNYLI